MKRCKLWSHEEVINIERSNFSHLLSMLSRDMNYLVNKQLRVHGLGKHDVWVMNAINAHSGITQNEICEQIGEDKITVSKSVKNLVQNGYVDSQKSEDDKRITCLYMTTYGLQIKNDIIAIIDGANQLVSQQLSDEEKMVLEELLSRIYNNVHQYVDTVRNQGL